LVTERPLLLSQKVDSINILIKQPCRLVSRLGGPSSLLQVQLGMSAV